MCALDTSEDKLIGHQYKKFTASFGHCIKLMWFENSALYSRNNETGCHGVE